MELNIKKCGNAVSLVSVYNLIFVKWPVGEHRENRLDIKYSSQEMVRMLFVCLLGRLVVFVVVVVFIFFFFTF